MIRILLKLLIFHLINLTALGQFDMISDKYDDCKFTIKLKLFVVADSIEHFIKSVVMIYDG